MKVKDLLVASVAMFFGGLKHQRQQLELKFYSCTMKTSTSQHGLVYFV